MKGAHWKLIKNKIGMEVTQEEIIQEKEAGGIIPEKMGRIIEEMRRWQARLRKE